LQREQEEEKQEAREAAAERVRRERRDEKGDFRRRTWSCSSKLEARSQGAKVASTCVCEACEESKVGGRKERVAVPPSTITTPLLLLAASVATAEDTEK
jgi:hypothetical protein